MSHLGHRRYGRRNDTVSSNRPLTGVTITFIRCLYRVTGVSIGQGGLGVSTNANSYGSHHHRMCAV